MHASFMSTVFFKFSKFLDSLVMYKCLLILNLYIIKILFKNLKDSKNKHKHE